MARLRLEEEARAYSRLLHSQSTPDHGAQDLAASPHAHAQAHAQMPSQERSEIYDEELTYADVSRQMALIINVLLSIVACSVAIWLVASAWSPARRLGLSMGGSGLVAVAEVAVYAGYLRRLKEAKARGKKKVETREIINTWVIAPSETREDAVDSKQATVRHRRRRSRRSSSDAALHQQGHSTLDGP